MRLVGVDVHGGGTVGVHANHHVVEDQLTTLAAAGDLDDLAVLDAQLLRLVLQNVEVTLCHDDALGQLHLAGGPDELTGTGALHVAALADGGVDAQRAGVGSGDLHLIRLTGGPEDGDVRHLLLGADDGQTLVAGVLTGIG